MNSRYKATYDFDSDMGRATGFLLLTSPSASASSPNLFWRFDTWIKGYELLEVHLPLAMCLSKCATSILTNIFLILCIH